MTQHLNPIRKGVREPLSKGFIACIGRILLILTFVLSLAGFSPLSVAQADAGWIAYNDCVTVSGFSNPANTTTTNCYTNGNSGALKNFATGAATGVTVSVTTSGQVASQTSSSLYGSIPDAGTDAYTTFNGLANIVGGIRFGNSSSYLILTFTGLDASKTYTFATTANRNDPDYTERITKFLLSDVANTSLANASTSGVDISTASIANDTSAFVTGYNTVNGYVTRWTGIQPGDDGDFSVRYSVDSAGSDNAYGPAVFLLQEEDTTTPTITPSGTLNVFTAAPGEYADVQSYTVSGSNLTGDILITAPDHFEISTASGSGFGSSLSLTPSGGVVTPTPIYVRFFSAAAGFFTGSITHTSAGATTKTVSVSGSAAVGWIAYNDCVYMSGQVSTNITTHECYTNGESGLLVDYLTGIDTPATVTVSTSGTIDAQDDSPYYGSEPGSGTDAYQTFHGIANMVGGVRLGSSSTYVQLAFTGLDPDETYTFATTANRNNTEYTTRTTRFVLSDVANASLTNASTSGVSISTASIPNDTSAFVTGYNTVNGYVTRWTGIQPGADGDFSVRYSVDSGSYAYGPAVFVLQQEGGAPINHAPDAPVLVSPADDAAGVSLAPTLQVAVSDPDGDPLDVSFYGRAAGSGSSGSGDPFTVVILPDTQNYSQYYPATFTAQTQWIVDHLDDQSIVFVGHEGDIANSPTTAQYDNADAAMSLLEDPVATGLADGVPYGISIGNHDTAAMFNTYFGETRFSGRAYYGGHYTTGNENNFGLFSAGGMDFVVIHLQYSPSSAMIDWADGILKANAARYGIVVSHSMLETSAAWTSPGSSIYEGLKDNPNLFLMLCGHNHGEAQRTDTYNGSTVYTLLADYQDYTNGGDGYLRLLQFSPADDAIHVKTYSPTQDNFLTDSNSEFDLAFAMPGTLAGSAWELIGVAEDVASGANAVMSWPGRAASTEYEWYAEADDGAKSTPGPTWSFTTGAAANVAPVLGDIGPQSINELIQLSFTAAATDDGLPSATLTFSLADGASGDVPDGAAITTAGAFTWTPTELQGPGNYTFDVCVSDGSLSDCDPVAVTVSEDNVAPVLSDIGGKGVAEGSQLSFAAAATDADIPAQALTFSLADGVSGDVPAGAAITTAGAFTWTPTELQGPGSYTFDVCVSDGSLSDCETIVVAVSEDNLAPVLGAIGGKSVAEGILLSFTATAVDADLPAQTLTFSLAGSVPAGAAITAAGAFTWTPAEGTNGQTFTFDVCVSDGTASDCETIAVVVTDTNQTPALNPIGDRTASEGVLFSFTATAVDADLPADTLTFSLAGSVPAGAAITAAGAFTWTPGEADGGQDFTFDICVSDGQASDCETVAVTVTEVNTAPVAATDEYSTPVNAALVVDAAGGILANDADVDGDDLGIEVLTEPQYGVLVVNAGGSFTYTPDGVHDGDFTFTYRLFDGSAYGNTATVTLHVLPIVPGETEKSIYLPMIHFD